MFNGLENSKMVEYIKKLAIRLAILWIEKKVDRLSHKIEKKKQQLEQAKKKDIEYLP